MSSVKALHKNAIILLATLAIAFCLPACAGLAAQSSGESTALESDLQMSGEQQKTEEADGSSALHPDTGKVNEETEITTDLQTGETGKMKTLQMKINEVQITVDWEENESVAALAELVKSGPLTVQMSMYGGFEQVGSLGTSLPRSDVQTVTQAGDIVLYSGNQIVVFYGTNTWAYTRLGHISDKTPEELSRLLGNGDVTVTLSAPDGQ